MTFTNYIKGQLIDFVDNYKKYYWQTLSVTLVFTVISYVAAALLFRFSYSFDEHTRINQISIASYFFHRFSRTDSYNIIDLTKTFYIFLVALFSIGLTRLTNVDIGKKEFSFNQFISKIKLNDIGYLLLILCIASFIDFALVKFESYLTNEALFKSTSPFIRNTIFHLRIYIPLFMFALSIRYLTKNNKTKLTFIRILFLYISLWLFNEFAYEFSLWVRSHIIGLILLPVEDANKFYVFESLLSIPLVAFYFLGYHSSMTTSLNQTEELKTEE